MGGQVAGLQQPVEQLDQGVVLPLPDAARVAFRGLRVHRTRCGQRRQQRFEFGEVLRSHRAGDPAEPVGVLLHRQRSALLRIAGGGAVGVEVGQDHPADRCHGRRRCRARCGDEPSLELGVLTEGGVGFDPGQPGGHLVDVGAGDRPGRLRLGQHLVPRRQRLPGKGGPRWVLLRPPHPGLRLGAVQVQPVHEELGGAGVAERLEGVLDDRVTEQRLLDGAGQVRELLHPFQRRHQLGRRTRPPRVARVGQGEQVFDRGVDPSEGRLDGLEHESIIPRDNGRVERITNEHRGFLEVATRRRSRHSPSKSPLATEVATRSRSRHSPPKSPLATRRGQRRRNHAATKDPPALSTCPSPRSTSHGWCRPASTSGGRT